MGNAIFIGIQTQHLLQKEIKRAKSQTLGESVLALRTIEMFFCAFFLCELVIRIVADRFEFFRGRERHWNIFDTALVLLCVVEITLDNIQLKLYNFKYLKMI